jgi:mono/diheme cytochrome c family protein
MLRPAATAKTHGLYLQQTRTMRSTIRAAFLTSALTATLSVALAAGAPQQPTHPSGGAHLSHAAALRNPVVASAASIAAGKIQYEKQCAGCHGDSGKGDGAMGEELNPKPADLTDAEWKHGSTDGEIFTVIHDGVKTTGMKPFARKMTTHQMWDLVNYLRSLGAH